eukprot:3514615-Amphidinium_carterae.2
MACRDVPSGMGNKGAKNDPQHTFRTAFQWQHCAHMAKGFEHRQALTVCHARHGRTSRQHWAPFV